MRRAIEAGAIHVYGRDETIAAVRAAARPGVVVRGHGAGLGVALVTPAADLGARPRRSPATSSRSTSAAA